MLWGVCGSHRRNKTRPAGPNSGWGLGAEEEAWLRCPWAVVGPGRASRRRAEQHQRPGPTGVEGAGGSGEHGRASRCGDERNEVA